MVWHGTDYADCEEVRRDETESTRLLFRVVFIAMGLGQCVLLALAIKGFIDIVGAFRATQ